MRSTEARIVRLEDRRPNGCPACHWWAPTTWTVVRDDELGRQERQQPNRPETCPTCGRVVPAHVNRDIIMRRVTRRREDANQ